MNNNSNDTLVALSKTEIEGFPLFPDLSGVLRTIF